MMRMVKVKFMSDIVCHEDSFLDIYTVPQKKLTYKLPSKGI